jgi:HD-like signal output (HDOD) protein
MNANVLEAIKKSAAVPSMPQVVSRFLEIMQDPNFDYGDLVRVLSVDPGTVSEILRLVNSALFGVHQKIVSLRQAITLLGPKRTRSVLLGRFLVDTIAQKQLTGLDMSYFWRRSLACAVVASRFAETVAPRHREETFIAGLLADIGVPILCEAMPAQYRTIVSEYAPNGAYVTPEQEQDAVDVTHAQVSAMVLAHWTLPNIVTSAVNLQHSPSPGDSQGGAIARILNASDRIAKLLCESPDVESAAIVCAEATAFVGVKLDLLVHLLSTIENDIEELADVLRIDVIPTNAYTAIVASIQERLTASTGA